MYVGNKTVRCVSDEINIRDAPELRSLFCVLKKTT